jgi:acyl-CoA synthetase (AMP-forming)/AMP-acid ligase II
MTSIQEALERLWDADDASPLLQQDGDWVSWGRVRSLSEEIGQALVEAGCGAGGRTAVVLSNRWESVAAVVAILRGGHTLVTLSPLQPSERLSEDLAASRSSFVLAPESLWSGDTFKGVVTDICAAGWALDGDQLSARAHADREPIRGDPTVAVEMLTSGTTGPPKRVPLSYAQLQASLSAAVKHNGRPAVSDRPLLTGAVGMVSLPIVHIGGLWGLLQALVTARRFVLLERFTVPGWHAAVKEHRPVAAGLPPAAIRAVLDSDDIGVEDLSSIRAINAGTSPVDPDLVDAFLERFGVPIIIVYGATEFCGAVAGWTLKDFHQRWVDKRGSVGRAFPGVRLRVVDDGGAEVAADTSGRLEVASAQVGVVPGKWVTTSDLAHIDDQGFLYIDGRADDVILRGGFKIAPETVVIALRRHPAVSDAAVAGLPDPRLGHVPVAAVELRPNASASGEELRAHCRSLLTPYEVPVAVYVVEELPRGAALKVDRRALTAMLEDARVHEAAPAPAGTS